jgi:galactokinase
MILSTLGQDFSAIYDRLPEAVFFAPGRVNLIGEHIDYNGGRVMPAAISTGTWFAVSRNGTDRLNIYSSLFGEMESVDLTGLAELKAGRGWLDYISGMLLQLNEQAGRLSGVDILVASDMPQNSGLSSSASFTVGFGFAVSELLGFDLDPVALALAARAVENDFVGVNCGIMDQFAVALGKAGHCIVLDCDTLEYELLPMNLADHEIVIVNSMVPRKLSESNYNLRRSECEQALAILKNTHPVSQLCELSVEQVESCAELAGYDVLRRRARHAASENARVHDSVVVLKRGQLAHFGAFMNASHDSLRDDYEVSCPELDLLVDTARSIPGVLGSRMTGAGFGGCTVSIVESAAVPEFEARLVEAYARETPYTAKVLTARPSDGIKRVA